MDRKEEIYSRKGRFKKGQRVLYNFGKKNRPEWYVGTITGYRKGKFGVKLDTGEKVKISENSNKLKLGNKRLDKATIKKELDEDKAKRYIAKDQPEEVQKRRWSKKKIGDKDTRLAIQKDVMDFFEKRKDKRFNPKKAEEILRRKAGKYLPEEQVDEFMAQHGEDIIDEVAGEYDLSARLVAGLIQSFMTKGESEDDDYKDLDDSDSEEVTSRKIGSKDERLAIQKDVMDFFEKRKGKGFKGEDKAREILRRKAKKYLPEDKVEDFMNEHADKIIEELASEYDFSAKAKARSLAKVIQAYKIEAEEAESEEDDSDYEDLDDDDSDVSGSSSDDDSDDDEYVDLDD